MRDGRRAESGAADGDFMDSNEYSVMADQWAIPAGTAFPATLWNGAPANYQDTQVFGGYIYWTTGAATADSTHFISRGSLTTNTTSLAVQRTAFPLYGAGADTNPGPSYLAVGDPDGDGAPDIYAHMGATGNAAALNVLGHWEDTDGNGLFTSGEMIDSIVLDANARDVELVQGAGHFMIVYINSSSVVKYVNLMDNGAITGEKGDLFTTGLTPNNTTFMHLKMDQTAIPEPATLLLLGTGALGVLGYIRRQRMKQ